MNALERAIAALSPAWANRRAKHIAELRAYEAADTGRLRKTSRQTRGPNRAVRQAIKPIRETARKLEEDHDLIVGVLNTLATNVVGPHGISVEPQPKTPDGSLNEELAAELRGAWDRWCTRPESTGRYDRATMERSVCLSWARDGEAFGQHLEGSVAGIAYPEGAVPYSLELLEADLCPLDFDDSQKGIVQGVQLDRWGRPSAYWLYEAHPQDSDGVPPIKSIKADRILHIAYTRRLRQVRGMSMLASVMNRLRDLKDYEEAERVAARISAAMTMVIKKGTPEMYSDADTDSETGARLFDISPGMVWDSLSPGESVEQIQSARPSVLLQPFRDSMLKAIAAGTGTSYSSIARSYEGSYSSQRQELVESFMNYSTLTAQFTAQWTRPVYQRFVAAWLLSRQGGAAGVDPLTIDDAEFRGPVMPWIDPAREANALVEMVQAGFKSRAQVIRERGATPDTVYQQLLRERTRDYEDSLIFKSDYAHLAQRGEIDSSPKADEGFESDTADDDAASAA